MDVADRIDANAAGNVRLHPFALKEPPEHRLLQGGAAQAEFGSDKAWLRMWLQPEPLWFRHPFDRPGSASFPTSIPDRVAAPGGFSGPSWRQGPHGMTERHAGRNRLYPFFAFRPVSDVPYYVPP